MSASTFPVSEPAPPGETPNPRALWLWLALLFALGVAAPFVPVPNAFAAFAGGAALVLIYVAAMIGIALGAARLQLSPAKVALLLVLTLGIWAVGRFVLIQGVLEPFNRANFAANRRPELWQVFGGRQIRTLTDLSLIMAATWGGVLVSHLIKSRNLLGPICAMIALIDIWGVLFGGIVSQLMNNPMTKAASQNALAGVPQLGGATAGAASRYAVSLPYIGAGDYLFLGLLFAVLVRLGMNWRGAVQLTYPLVAGALLAIALGAPFLPGLLFIGAGVALPNLRYFKFSREENFALLYASGFVILLTGALYFALMRQLPPGK